MTTPNPYEEVLEEFWDRINGYCVSHATDYKELRKDFDRILHASNLALIQRLRESVGVDEMTYWNGRNDFKALGRNQEKARILLALDQEESNLKNI